HGVQSRHVRDDGDHAGHQSAAGRDPRSRRHARCAGAAKGRDCRRDALDTHAVVRSPDPLRRRGITVPRADPRAAGSPARSGAVTVELVEAPRRTVGSYGREVLAVVDAAFDARSVVAVAADGLRAGAVLHVAILRPWYAPVFADPMARVFPVSSAAADW